MMMMDDATKNVHQATAEENKSLMQLAFEKAKQRRQSEEEA